jgi:hypothetical protein
MIAIRPASAGVQSTCPAALQPAALNNSRDCKFCMSCVRQGGMKVLLRWPFSPADARAALSWPAALFVGLTTAALLWRRTGDARLAIAVWPAVATVAWALGGGRTPWDAFRRLALPGSVMLIAAHVAGFLPLAGAIPLLVISVFLAVSEAIKAGLQADLAMIGSLQFLVAAFAYSLTWPS